MAPPEWATLVQLDYLHQMLPKFCEARLSPDKSVAMEHFWKKLDETWFTMYPVEQELGIICDGPGAEPLTPEQLKSIGKATDEQKRVSRFVSLAPKKY
jgi:hypothetical protein